MIDRTVGFLAARAVQGVEDASDGAYRRTLRLEHGAGRLELPSGRVQADDPRDRAAAEAARRRLAGADPAEADAHLGADPVLGPLIARRPGLRVPGTVDGGERAIRAVLGQQGSLAAARTLAGRLVAAAGEPLRPRAGALTHLWPRPQAVAAAAHTMPMPRSRQRALAALAGALAAGDLPLDPGVDRAETRRRLLGLPGIGPWTADYVAMRALADPDAWLPGDVGVRRAIARLGAPADAAERWRPFRAHAVVHLWASLGDG
jgi:AraC family transcriptional regulator of adaptative response / DNA-3-methyladenine glycosylase II